MRPIPFPAVAATALYYVMSGTIRERGPSCSTSRSRPTHLVTNTVTFSNPEATGSFFSPRCPCMNPYLQLFLTLTLFFFVYLVSKYSIFTPIHHNSYIGTSICRECGFSHPLQIKVNIRIMHNQSLLLTNGPTDISKQSPCEWPFRLRV
jgi:hypothetical protein